MKGFTRNAADHATALTRMTLVGFLSLIVTSCCLSRDGELCEHFQENRATVERILEMANEDSDVIRIARDFTWLKDDLSWPRSQEELGFSPERWAEYRDLFEKADLAAGILRKDERVFFLVERCGIVGSGRINGYVHSPTTPAPLLRRLSDLEKEGIGFAPLEGNWYVFAERD